MAASKLPVLKVSCEEVDLSIPGLTQIQWGDLLDKSKLGEGSFGEVFLAKIKDELVVVKKLQRQKRKKERDMFAKEVRILSGLRCKHIVSVEGYCPNPVALVLEYIYFDFKPLGIDGDHVSSLKEYFEFLSNGKLVYQLSCLQPKIARDVVTAIEYLHGKNIVHRDIKPANVLVSNKHYCNMANSSEVEQAWLREGIVCKLADFGESRSKFDQTATLHHTRTTNLQRGTLVFNPPEALDGRHKLVSCSLDELKQGDIWSLGMLLFVLLNPELEIPYSQELEERDIEDSSEARVLLGELMDRKEKPAHSNVHESLRVEQWSQINKAYEMCTAFQPSERASACDVLTVLREGKLEKLNVEADISDETCNPPVTSEENKYNKPSQVNSL